MLINFHGFFSSLLKVVALHVLFNFSLCKNIISSLIKVLAWDTTELKFPSDFLIKGLVNNLIVLPRFRLTQHSYQDPNI